MKKIIIVGAGASGLMAAIAAARQGAAVTVLEQMEKPGKKLLVTGNGRCNLTNRKAPGKDTYRGAEEAFVSRVLGQFPVESTLEFFHGLGLLTRERDWYVYPYTDQAGSVLEVLMQEIRRLKVKMKYKERVMEIRRAEEGFSVHTATWEYVCDAVVLCAGGMAAAQTGSDGSGYALARKCGHSVRPVYPALVPLKVQGSIPRMLSGTRNYVRLTLEIDGKARYQDFGELQWTDYGVSGIVVFQLSRFAAEALGEKRTVRLHVDMMPEYSKAEIMELLEQKSACVPEQSGAELLAGLWKEKTIRTFLKLYGNNRKNFCENAISFIKNLTLEVTGTKPFEMAQVCAGGVPAEELCAETLESRIFPGLYLAGELLDVDGACGGYNLQWAWTSGYLAGSSAGREV